MMVTLGISSGSLKRYHRARAMNECQDHSLRMYRLQGNKADEIPVDTSTLVSLQNRHTHSSCARLVSLQYSENGNKLENDK